MSLRSLIRGRDDGQSHVADADPGRQTERAIRLLVIVGGATLIGIITSGLVGGGGVRFIIWALIAGLSAATIGGALGLLFGLPTSHVGPAPATQPPPAPAPAPVAPTGTVPASQAPATVAAAAAPMSEQRELDVMYRDSTSLEQVADWLTKIIVGLTLTQYASWEARFETLSRNLTEAMLGPAGLTAACQEAITGLTGVARATALNAPVCQIGLASPIPGGVLIALCATIGFLISYLWMRRYFIIEMMVARRAARVTIELRQAKSNSDVAAETKSRTESELTSARAEAEKLKAALERAIAETELRRAQEEKQRAKLEEVLRAAREQGRAQTTVELTKTHDSGVVRILRKGAKLLPAESAGAAALAEIEAAVTDKPTDPEDPWRGKFGEQQSAGGRTLEATVSLTTDPNTFRVELAVRTLDQPPEARLVGTKVLFYLHPTFGEDPRVSTLGEDGRAPLELYAFGAFTVGALCEDGTRLELNLATLAGAPDTFRSR